MTSERKYYRNVVAIGYVIWVAMYVGIGYLAKFMSPVDTALEIDSSIPLLPGFVWVYLSGFVMPIFLLMIAKDWHRINLVLLSLVIAHLVAFTIFLNLPANVPKPDVGYSISDRMLGVLYALESSPRSNNLPSLHVIFALTIAAGSLRQSMGKPAEILVFTWGAFVAASTLFVKQHLALDVVSALVITAGTWALAKFLYSRVLVQPLDPRSELRELTRHVGPWLLFGFVLVLVITAVRRFFL